MKRILLSVLFIAFLITDSYSQIQMIRPDSAVQGQTLTTTITMVNGAFSTASAPYQNTDIYLQQGATIIYCYPGYSTANVYVPYDSLWTDFTIPGNAPSGYYDLNVITYDWQGTPTTWTLINGFHIGYVVGYAEGDLYFDSNQNGTWDAAEPPLYNHRVLVTPGGYSVYSDALGHYKAYLDSGNYTLSYNPNATFNQTSVPLNYNVTIPPSYVGQDFGAYSAANLYGQYFYVWHHPMRCQPSLGYTYIDITNNGTLIADGSITMVHSPNLSLNTAVPAPDIISGDTLTWYYNNLLPGQSIHIGGANGMDWIAFNDPPAGQTIWYTTVDSVFDQLGNPMVQYTDSFGFDVTCSCDPNDKWASPFGTGSQHNTLPNTDLTYTINFQNTGNDTAFTVIIMDTLDVNLDWNTFEVISSTHPVNTQMDANGVVKFTFENIFLPDSNVNEPGSHGAVAYKIKTDSLLPDPTEITNTAYIYFDWNPPVVTNTTLNTITLAQLPVASFMTGDLNFCPGSCINFLNQSVSGTSYLWLFPGANTVSSTSTDPTNICYTVSGIYDVTLIATNSFGSDTVTYTNYLEVYTVAPQAIYQSGDTLFANGGFVNYIWYYNGNIINGANSYYYVATQNGDYHVISFDANGCDVEAAIFNVMTAVGMNIVEPFEIYPNPVTDKLEIRGTTGSIISVYNVLGEKVMFVQSASVNTNKSTELDMSGLTPGIYTIEITGGQNLFRATVVKQ